MSDSQTENEMVRRLEETLKKMLQDLRLFSMSMRSLYSDENPGTSTDVSRKFTKLRDDTREDAKVYLKVILPLITKYVCSIEEIFEYYNALSYEEWCDSLPDIFEKIKASKDFAETLLKMHEEIIVSLKKREDESRIIMTEFKYLQTEFENAAKELESKAETKRNWAFVLAFIPLVNVIATPLLRSCAYEDSLKAIATIHKSKIHESAALVVDETLIPSLANFIEGLCQLARFFETMEIELNSFDERGKEIKVSHYEIIKNKVQKINSSCREFYAALPAIRTDFEAIPDGDIQQNYVEKWLEKRQKEIGIKEKALKSFLGCRQNNTKKA